MTPWLDDGDVRLFLGDCVEVMAAMPAESVDAVVCDPPYGLEFMGKEWDAPWRDSARWRSASRLPGSRSSNPTPRPQGWGDAGAPFAAWCETWAREALRVLKPGGHLLAFGGTRTFHRLTCGIEDAGFEVRDCLSWLYGSGFPKSLDVSKAIDKAAGAERDTPRSWGANRERHDPLGTLTGRAKATGWCERCGKSRGSQAANCSCDTTGAPATDAAREWQGWGTALKPGWEPCVVARKPLAGTVAENVQAHGSGAVNVDGCRIGREGATKRGDTSANHATATGWNTGHDIVPLNAGRWPANVALDEAAAAMLDAQSGTSSSKAAAMPLPMRPGFAGSRFGGDGATGDVTVRGFTDTGGASRFFYTAKASRADRNTSGATNTHPTVKPTDLMRWLVRLVTPPGGVVLDPFAGSGSTLVAARAEGFRAVGIEREQEYADIIAARLSQLSLFTEGME